MGRLTVLGGAGVRAPLLMPALARRQEAINLSEVVLMDVDEHKLELIGPICRYVAETRGARFTVHWTTEPREALTGAHAVITTIRAGAEAGRALDERIALDHGVLGQETTGPAGFAMALRTVPAVAEYARLMLDCCPDAWLFNFTNPAGLVVQALTEQFPTLRIVGICDSPSSLRQQIAGLFGKRAAEMPVRFFGLNHLSWMAEAMVDGRDVVPVIVRDEALQVRLPELAFFEPHLLRLLGMLPNEYLYYYYYRDSALANIRTAGETRGEQIARLSGELLRDLEDIVPASNPGKAYERYRAYIHERHGSYMATETSSTRRLHTESDEQQGDGEVEGEGYAGVALDILAAERGTAASLVANVPNEGAVPGMSDDDVVEVTCSVEGGRLRPAPAGEVPHHALLLMKQVKLYERLAVRAIRERSRDLATEALMAHPLVGSYTVSRSLVDAYLEAHRETVGEWVAA